MTGKEKLSILITGSVLTGNKGAVAMFFGTRRILTEALADFDLTFSMLSPRYSDDIELAQEHDVKLYRDGGVLRRAIPLALTSKVVPVRKTHQVLEAYSKADLVVDISGITYCDSDRLVSTAVVPSAHILLARLLGKPFVKFTQTFGPMGRRATRWAAKVFLDRCLAVVPRDVESEKCLRHLRIRTATPMCVDSAFGMAAEGAAERTGGGLLFGISPNQIIEGKDPGYPELMARVVDFVALNVGAKVVLIPHYSKPHGDTALLDKSYNNDFALIEKIMDLADAKENVSFVDKELSPQQLKGMIGSCDLFIGSRYHSLVASVSMGVPSIAIGWSHKYDGLLEMAGIGEYAFSYQELNLETLTERITEMVSRQDALRERLRKSRKRMLASSCEAGRFVRERLC